MMNDTEDLSVQAARKFYKNSKIGSKYTWELLGILASSGYPSCTSGLIRHLKLQTWKKDEVYAVHWPDAGRTDVKVKIVM